MRCFIAITLPDDVREKIAAFASECAAVLPGRIKPSAAQNLHLTLSFLGETAPGRFDEIFSSLDQLRSEPFHLVFRGAGFFPEDGPPHVLWAGAEKSSGLCRLNERCEKTVEELGFPRTSPGFVPHITVGRVKGEESGDLAEFMLANRGLYFGEFDAEMFSFYTSDLSGKDPVYTAVRDFGLG